jgi:hypothetical protein
MKRWITVFSVKICMSNSRSLYRHITKKSIGSQLDCCPGVQVPVVAKSRKAIDNHYHLLICGCDHLQLHMQHICISVSKVKILVSASKNPPPFAKKSSCICTVWWLLQRKTVVDAYCIEKLPPPCPISTSNLHFPKGVHMALSFPLPRAGLAQ